MQATIQEGEQAKQLTVQEGQQAKQLNEREGQQSEQESEGKPEQLIQWGKTKGKQVLFEGIFKYHPLYKFKSLIALAFIRLSIQKNQKNKTKETNLKFTKCCI